MFKTCLFILLLANIFQLQVLKATYFGVVFGVALPLLLGVAVDMYIFMPIRYSKSTDALVIHISEVSTLML